MRSIWKGSIAFGLVNVPVKLASATGSHDVSLHQVHDKDGGRIRYQRRCEVCGRVIPYDHIDKAYESGDETVVLSDDDLAGLPVERDREIKVVEFVPSEQLDPVLFERSYYLEPDSRSVKAYVLLRRTLEKTERTAIASFALRQKTHLAALRVRGEVLLLQTLLWPDEVREPDFGDIDATVTSRELAMSAELVQGFAADFDPERYHDEYQEQLRALIDAKLERGEAVATEQTTGEEGGTGEVLDLMEALRRSVEKSRGAKAGAKKGAAAKGAAAKKSRTRKPAKKGA